MNNVNNQFKNSGYVPFNLNSINKNYTLDSILILDNGSYFLGRSFGSKKNALEKYALTLPFLAIKK